jgi:choline-sulfatase
VADAPERYLTMYAPEEVPLRPNVDLSRPLDNQDYWFKVYRWDFRHYSLHLPYTEHLPEGYDLRRLIAEYYGLTTWMDDAFGRMLAALDRAGLAENTVVVFTSDHGDNLGSLGLVQKGGPNEESIRIPLIVCYPGGLSPAVVGDRVVSLVDVAPTLIRMAGGTAPAHMAGQSLLAPARDHTPAAKPAFIEIGNSVAVRTPTHMCFFRRERDGGPLENAPAQFYDLTADPYQLQNLAGTSEQADTARRLADLVRRWDQATPWMALA